ncbi:Uncharacterised protein [Providencia stuartii]|nr:Uncharacterised protein [Providencia stuartii]
MNIFKKLITGQYSLTITFGVFGVAGYFLVTAVSLAPMYLEILYMLQAVLLRNILCIILLLAVTVGLASIFRKKPSILCLIAILIVISRIILDGIWTYEIMTL